MKALIAILLYGWGKLTYSIAELVMRLAQRNDPISRTLLRLVPLNWLSGRGLKLARHLGIQFDWSSIFSQTPQLVESLSDEELEKFLEGLKDDEKYFEVVSKFPVLKEFEGARQRLTELLENEKFLREHRKRQAERRQVL
ncbi:MAG: hypothetical protein DRP11_04680 [Candidatus Aenigmatarchaeota archaeon]|nr:MAG: hypothetical protein DRP11_04680 [Candidatus Aenigmarchaeota archaeon]